MPIRYDIDSLSQFDYFRYFRIPFDTIRSDLMLDIASNRRLCDRLTTPLVVTFQLDLIDETRVVKDGDLQCFDGLLRSQRVTVLLCFIPAKT